MKIQFHKYQATGNDFILINNREGIFPVNPKLINTMCDRRFGIGSDGLILIGKSNEVDFTMTFYNPDGTQSFCGNGSRAAIHFAYTLKLIGDSARFKAYDGVHEGFIMPEMVKVSMRDVQNGRMILNGIFIDTGSPHYVEVTENVELLNLMTQGKEIRNDQKFHPKGTNVNFIEKTGKEQIKVRTYERGVENETYSCGTGVTASALVSVKEDGSHHVSVTTKGGGLTVSFEKGSSGFSNIWLEGPAERVYKGEYNIQSLG